MIFMNLPEDLLWELRPDATIIEAFRLNTLTAIAATLGIATFIANLFMTIWYSLRQPQAGESIKKAKYRRYGVFGAAFVFLVSTILIAWQIRMVKGTRQVHYNVTSQAFRVALDNRVLAVDVDSTGGGIVTTDMTIRAPSPKQHVSEFELEYRLPDFPRDDGGRSIHAQKKEIKCEGDRVLILKERRCYAANSHRLIAHITPPLPPGQSTKMMEKLVTLVPSQSLAMTESEAKERKLGDPFQYFEFKILYPCSKLTLSIRFPQGFQPLSAKFHASYGELKVPHLGEEQYLRDQFADVFMVKKDSFDVTTIKLIVDHPLIGLFYGIGWIPPEIWPDSIQQAIEFIDSTRTEWSLHE